MAAGVGKARPSGPWAGEPGARRPKCSTSAPTMRSVAPHQGTDTDALPPRPLERKLPCSGHHAEEYGGPLGRSAASLYLHPDRPQSSIPWDSIDIREIAIEPGSVDDPPLGSVPPLDQ